MNKLQQTDLPPLSALESGLYPPPTDPSCYCKRSARSLFEWLELFVWVIGITLLIFSVFLRVAVVDGDTQYVTTTLHANGYDDIQVTAGIAVEWTILADSADLNGCNNEIVLPFAGQQIRLSEGENTICFLLEEAGTYPYSCWMGMIRGSITVVDSADA